MKIYRYPTNLTSVVPGYKGCVLSFGNFDGIHLGHQKLISKINERSSNLKVPSVLINFYPHPLKVIKGEDVKFINSFREKSFLVKKLGIDFFYMHIFNNEVRNLKADRFLDLIIDKLNPIEVYVGEDASIGVNREGDVNFMSSYLGAKKITCKAVKFISNNESDKVSSSQIRNFVLNRDFKALKKSLGRDYSMFGKVIKGKRIARKLDFKTANINCRTRLTPKFGVYVTKVIIDGKNYNSVSNLGVKPTYGTDYPLLETHILNNDLEDFYGKVIEVVFIEYIRDEVKFNSPAELKEQIIRDCEVAKAIHDERN